MAHEITRILAAFSKTAWFMHPSKAEQIIAMLEMRASGPFEKPAGTRPAAEPEKNGKIAILKLQGTILPRTSLDLSDPGGVSLVAFQGQFRSVANDTNVKAIILEIDSPGGQVDLVPETVAMIRAAKRADRPIIAIANTMAASAAYWIASAADELVVTPSGEVGSIGVYMLHQDVSQALEAEGVKMTFISSGPRKTEGSPFEPLDDVALAALQVSVADYYDMFTKDVAKARGVPVSVVRADPEKSEQHFGGGRCYTAKRAVALGMADRVATLEETITRVSRKSARRTDIARRRLALA